MLVGPPLPFVLLTAHILPVCRESEQIDTEPRRKSDVNSALPSMEEEPNEPEAAATADEPAAAGPEPEPEASKPEPEPESKPVPDPDRVETAEVVLTLPVAPLATLSLSRSDEGGEMDKTTDVLPTAPELAVFIPPPAASAPVPESPLKRTLTKKEQKLADKQVLGLIACNMWRHSTTLCPSLHAPNERLPLFHRPS